MDMTARRNTMSFPTAPKPEAAVSDESDPGPRVFIAPELRGRRADELEAIRNPDDSDEDFERSRKLMALFTEAAKEP